MTGGSDDVEYCEKRPKYIYTALDTVVTDTLELMAQATCDTNESEPFDNIFGCFAKVSDLPEVQLEWTFRSNLPRVIGLKDFFCLSVLFLFVSVVFGCYLFLVFSFTAFWFETRHLERPFSLVFPWMSLCIGRWVDWIESNFWLFFYVFFFGFGFLRDRYNAEAVKCHDYSLGLDDFFVCPNHFPTQLTQLAAQFVDRTHSLFCDGPATPMISTSSFFFLPPSPIVWVETR